MYGNYYTPTPQQNSGLIWVSGEAGAKAYLVAPNNTVMLLDSEGNKFYLKSCDQMGMPMLRTFEYNEITQNNVQAPQIGTTDLDGKYVTHEELDALKGQLQELASKLEKRGRVKNEQPSE